MRRKLGLLFLPILLPALNACVSNSTEKPQSPEILAKSVEEILESLSEEYCGKGIVQSRGGSGVGASFEEEFHIDRGCTNSVFWYEYKERGIGKTLVWSDDIDQLNDKLRLVHEDEKIAKLVSGPNPWPVPLSHPLPTYLDEKYKPGAIRPPAESFREDVASIASTVWDAIDSFDRVFALHFNENGSMQVESNGSANGNATWEQDGNTIFFEVNDNYIERYGTIDNDSMAGNTWNKTGSRWTWTAKKRQ